MIKIVFVCFGNICRSPMAEFVMKALVNEAGLAKKVVVESSGCYPQVGTPISRGTCSMLTKYKIPFEQRGSRQLQRGDYKKFDYLIGLDRENVSDMEYICGGDPDKKIFLLLDFAGEHRSVDDPWYTDDYETTYEDVLKGCSGLLSEIQRRL